MKNTVVETKKENERLVSLNYQGVIYFITEQEFKDLKDGYLSFEDMFD